MKAFLAVCKSSCAVVTMHGHSLTLHLTSATRKPSVALKSRVLAFIPQPWHSAVDIVEDED